MNVTYNLSKRNQHEYAVAMNRRLYVVGETMDAYIGRDSKTAGLQLLVRCETATVMLHESPLASWVTCRAAPRWPWAFSVGTLDPLLAGANYQRSATDFIDVYAGVDACDDEFLAITLNDREDVEHYIFRSPMKGRSTRKVEAWPGWAMSPLRCTASETAKALARDALAHASGHEVDGKTGDAELDRLLAGLPVDTESLDGADRNENEEMLADKGGVDQEASVAGKGEAE